MTRILQQPDIVAKLGWLRKALLPHGGLNLLTLLDCDLAGSHAIGRLDAHDDFDLKIDKPEGFVRVFPILILNKDDEYLQSAPKKSRKKPTTNKPQSTGDNTHTESE